jgi:hypothetical protein
MRHQDLTLNHRLETWVYANAAARTGATGFVSGDVGRIAYQSDNGTYWRLTATTPTWASVGLPNATNVLFLTTGTTYTPTAGARALLVECLAGGGGGGGAPTASSNLSVGSGGASGGYSATYLSGTLKSSYAYQIGAGGTAGAATAGLSGGTGGDTAFDSPNTCLAKGGLGGTASGPGSGITTIIGGVGGGGGSGIGDLKVSGNDGGHALRLAATTGIAGFGAAGIWGGSPRGTNDALPGNGNAGKNFGAGGSGALATSTAGTGGVGAQGVIKVTEFF